jgi:hypothetical protein
MRTPVRLQPKLKVNTPGDRFEQEADSTAASVMRMSDVQVQRQTEDEAVQAQPLAGQITSLVQCQGDDEDTGLTLQRQEEEEEEHLQAKELSGQSPTVTPALEARLSAKSGSGQPLPEETRGFMESRFGQDFSRVRVHTGTAAEQSAREVNANAYTVGHNIVFSSGRFAPETHVGRRLLAHELAHVIQQRDSRFQEGSLLFQQGGGAKAAEGVTKPGDPSEIEADRIAETVSTGNTAGPISVAPTRTIARQVSPSAGKDIAEFEVYAGPTDHPKWIDRSIIAVAYMIWRNGYTIYLEGMQVGEQYPGIHIPESHVDFTVEKANPINTIIYDSRTEALAAVAVAPKTDGPPRFAFYWGAGGRVVVPTLICPGSAPRTTEIMWGAIKMYAEYVEGEVTGIAKGMVIFKGLGIAYGKAIRAGSGGKTPLPPGTQQPNEGGGSKVVPPSVETSTGPKVVPPSVETSTAPKALGQAPGKQPVPTLQTDSRAELVWVTEESKLYYRQGRPLYGETKGRYITLGEAQAAGYRESKMDPATERGIAQHSEEKRLLRPEKGKPLGKGWELRWVDESVGGKNRPDAVYVKEPQGSDKGRVVVIDTFTGEVEPLEHARKGWSYQIEKEIKALIDKGYEYGYSPALRNQRYKQ